MISFKEFCRIDEAIPVSAQGVMKYINLIMKGIKAKNLEISDVKNNMFVVTFTSIPKLNNQNMSLLLTKKNNNISNIIGVAISDEILDTTAKFKPIPSNITSVKDVINGLIIISKITGMSKPVSAFKDTEDLNVVSLSGTEEEDKKLKPKSLKELKELINTLIKERGIKADLNDIDVSQIINMNYLFNESDFNGNISKWDVSNVERMSEMFNNSKFNGDISDWDVSNVKNMSYMFKSSPLEKNLPKWYRNSPLY